MRQMSIVRIDLFILLLLCQKAVLWIKLQQIRNKCAFWIRVCFFSFRSGAGPLPYIHHFMIKKGAFGPFLQNLICFCIFGQRVGPYFYTAKIISENSWLGTACCRTTLCLAAESSGIILKEHSLELSARDWKYPGPLPRTSRVAGKLLHMLYFQF